MSRSAAAATGHQVRSHRVRTLVAGFAVGVLSLSACSAGQITQSANQRPGVDGSEGTVGPIKVQDATITPPTQDFWAEGNEIQLQLTIVNSSLEADELESVTYGEEEGLLEPTGAPTDGSSAPATSATPTADPSDQSGSAAPTTSAPTTSTPVSTPFDLPANSAFGVPKDGTITFGKAAEDLYPTQLVTFVFTFKNAGELTLKIPVGVPLENEAPGSEFDFHGEEGEEGGEG